MTYDMDKVMKHVEDRRWDLPRFIDFHEQGEQTMTDAVLRQVHGEISTARHPPKNAPRKAGPWWRKVFA